METKMDQEWDKVKVRSGKSQGNRRENSIRGVKLSYTLFIQVYNYYANLMLN